MRIRHLSALAISALLLSGCANDDSGVPNFSSSCRDDVGDGIGQFDIARVDLAKDGDTVTMTFTLDAPVQGNHFAESGYFVNIYNLEGEALYQLGVSHRDGFQNGNFVFNNRSGRQTNYEDWAWLEDGVLVTEYPVDDLRNLDDPFVWDAAMTDGDDDLDYCAGPGERDIEVP